MTKQFENNAAIEQKNAEIFAGFPGSRPCDRDDILAAFHKVSSKFKSSGKTGQNLAGTGALVFEGELLEFPSWN